MARPPKPTALKLITGNPGKRATNANEPEPDLLVDLTPPAHLPPAVAEVWAEMAPKLRRTKVLTEVDTYLLEMTCERVAQFRLSMAKTADGKVLQRNEETGSVSLSPWEIIKSMSLKTGLALLKEWGATPAARSRVMIDPQQDLFADAADSPAARHFR